MLRAPDPLEPLARALAAASGLDPDARVPIPGNEKGRTMPVWTTFRDAAREQRHMDQARANAAAAAAQGAAYRDAPLQVFGAHGEGTLAQMRACMTVGNTVAAALCADGHLGYAQPVGAAIAYEGQVSISGVGFDIACGCMAVRLDTPASELVAEAPRLLADIRRHISFGVGRANAERVEHALLDDDAAWAAAGMEDYRQKAAAQLGTVGSGNHYVDLFAGDDGTAWIGVHFGSRGLGHTAATRYLKAAGGMDGMHVPPAVVAEDSELGLRYIAAMELAGRYAYAGREWVVERVRRMIGGAVTLTVHNHHNFAWRERHGGRDVWVVRKGCSAAWPGQRSFVGGSMGDDAVILEGTESTLNAAALYSTVHGAGRVTGRKEARRRFRRADMDAWLRERGVLLAGGDLDESPMAYRRLDAVLAAQGETIRVLHRLRPVVVVMAGPDEFDPFKD